VMRVAGVSILPCLFETISNKHWSSALGVIHVMITSFVDVCNPSEYLVTLVHSSFHTGVRYDTCRREMGCWNFNANAVCVPLYVTHVVSGT
jgi:hypothetical protein